MNISQTSRGGTLGVRTAALLGTVALAAATSGGAHAHQSPAPARDIAPAAAQAQCLTTADSVQHWSSTGAALPACVLQLRSEARAVLDLDPEPASSATWVCPTTPDAAEAWVRAVGVAACRR